MLDDHDRSTLLHQTLEHAEEDLDVAGVQTDRGLVKHENGILLATAHLARELKALGLSAREGGRRLAKREVTQPKVMEGLELLVGTLDVRDVRQGLVHRERQEFRKAETRVVDALLRPADTDGSVAIPAATAIRASDVHVRQELHVKRDLARAVAGGAAEASRVVREVASLETELARGVRARVDTA